MQRVQSLTVGLNAFTVFCTVIFLQILVLLNAVPMTNDILMSSSASITYFVMSLVTLIYLFACHECASYMVLQYHFIFVFLYGAVLLTIGIVTLVRDLKDVTDDTKVIYDTVLSANQIEYFINSSRERGVDPPNGQVELERQRKQNTQLAGYFVLVLGILIIIQALAVFVLKSKRDANRAQSIVAIEKIEDNIDSIRNTKH